jgi:hypothetical protein
VFRGFVIGPSGSGTKIVTHGIEVGKEKPFLDAFRAPPTGPESIRCRRIGPCWWVGRAPGYVSANADFAI